MCSIAKVTSVRARAYTFEAEMPTIAPMDPFPCVIWNELARESHIIPDGCDFRSFQTQCLDIVIGL